MLNRLLYFTSIHYFTYITQKPCYLLIKGPACFVFSSQNAPSPKYAIPLDGKKAVIIENHEHHATVVIQDALGDPEYKLIFDLSHDIELANRFIRAVSNQAVVSHIIHEKKVRSANLYKLV